jgi:hypothetical protein
MYSAVVMDPRRYSATAQRAHAATMAAAGAGAVQMQQFGAMPGLPAPIYNQEVCARARRVCCYTPRASRMLMLRCSGRAALALASAPALGPCVRGSPFFRHVILRLA